METLFGGKFTENTRVVIDLYRTRNGPLPILPRTLWYSLSSESSELSFFSGHNLFMARYKVLVNPVSGRGNGEIIYPQIESRLKELGADFDLCRTDYPGHAIELAAEASAEGYDAVVAVGGDGTANEVVNGLMRAALERKGHAALGVVSVGRGNDFAFGIGIPPDLDKACKVLVEGRKRWIDIGFVQGGDYPAGRYFGNGVGIGFDAVVGFEALKLKTLHGFPSYVVAALKTIFLYFDPPTLRVEYEGQDLIQPLLMLSIMNGRRMGGGFLMAPDGVVDDGAFNLCIAGNVSRAAVFGLIPRFMKGTQAGHPAISTAKVDHIRVTAVRGTIPAHADGETLCVAGKTLEARIYPKALEVITQMSGVPV